MTEDLALIRQAALEAGRLAADLRAQGLEIQSKVGGSPVTNGDLAVDAFLTKRLREARPDYGWLSEEAPDTEDRLSRHRVFMIDPIDGTSAYMMGRPWWSISIAIVEDGRPIAGVVYAPDPDEIYDAARGLGARLNGETIHASARPALDDAAMLGEARMFARPDWPIAWPPMRIEARNSVAYRMALVAAGTFDACVAISGKYDWDIAAADLIVEEAGGLSTDHMGQGFVYNSPIPRQRSLVCSGLALAPLLLERLGHIDL